MSVDEAGGRLAVLPGGEGRDFCRCQMQRARRRQQVGEYPSRMPVHGRLAAGNVVLDRKDRAEPACEEEGDKGSGVTGVTGVTGTYQSR